MRTDYQIELEKLIDKLEELNKNNEDVINIPKYIIAAADKYKRADYEKQYNAKQSDIEPYKSKYPTELLGIYAVEVSYPENPTIVKFSFKEHSIMKDTVTVSYSL